MIQKEPVFRELFFAGLAVLAWGAFLYYFLPPLEAFSPPYGS
jgi:hypothetical protein